MKTTIKKAVAAILGCAMLASLCTANVAFAEDRPLHIAYTAMPDALIQRLHSPGIPAGIGYAQISDTLVHKNEEGQFEPRLAERWEINEDASEYTFYLRQDVKWSDGEPLTAEDVVYTMEMLKEAPGFSVAVGNLEKAEAIDDYTVKMTLIKPNVVFLSSLSTGIFTAIHPKHGDEQWGEKYGTSVETTLSCGPYILTDWQPDVSMTFEANPDYYRGEPDIKEVVFHEMQDTNAAVVAMQSGEIDIWFNPITGTAYQTLSTAENVQIGEYISGRNEAIYMYCPSGTFSDVRMRQAVAYGINPEEALLVAADGMGELIDYLGDIGSTMSGNPDDYESPYAFTYDLEKAKALVAECGMEGAPVTV